LTVAGCDEYFTWGTEKPGGPPIDTETVFQWGSITKSLTATVVMLLADGMGLDLDEPIRSVIEPVTPFPRLGELGTIRQLLTHTTGWACPMPSRLSSSGTMSSQDPRPLFKFAAPGDLWGYNNWGYVLLGQLVESFTGCRYVDVVREQLLDPLSMLGATFGNVSHSTTGHIVERNWTNAVNPWTMPSVMRPAGGLAGNIRDLMKYGKVHLDGEGHPLTAQREVIRRCHLPYPERFGNPCFRAGAGWFLKYGTHGEEVLLHEGAGIGHRSLIMLVPKKRVGVCLLANSNSPEPLRLGEWTLELCGVRTQGTAQPSLPAVSYEGMYTIGSRLLNVRAEENHLVVWAVESSEVVHLEPSSRDTFRVCNGPYQGSWAEFIRAGSAEVKWFRLGGRVAAAERPQ
jgi:CubicO group peptidase (beta-lactamase class C family)